MKVIMISLVLMFLVVGILSAHPAATVSATYNATNKLLSVTFEHSVRSATDHFISKVIIKVNNTVTITHNLTVQDNLTGGTLSYKIPGLRTGDRISIQTDCNKGGRKTSQITVP